MCWSAAPTTRSLYSRSAFRARLVSASPQDWKAWNSGRDGNLRNESIVIIAIGSRKCAADGGLQRSNLVYFRGRGLDDSTRAASNGAFTHPFVTMHRSEVSRLPNHQGRQSIRRPTQSRAELQLKETANGTRRQKSPWSTVHCAGGPIPKR